MAIKKAPPYGADTLRRVQQAWDDYRARTKSSQAVAARALGMGTSGFNQYIRGEIELNTDFLVKYATLVGMDLSDLQGELGFPPTLRPLTITLRVRYTLSGRKTNRDVMVTAMGVSPGAYAVEIDVDGSMYPKGAVLLVSPDDEIRAGDTVILNTETAPVLGTLNIDQMDDTWWIALSHGGLTDAHVLQPGQVPHRVSGVHFPLRAKTKAFKAA
jgi:hypothetical protein